MNLVIDDNAVIIPASVSVPPSLHAVVGTGAQLAATVGVANMTMASTLEPQIVPYPREEYAGPYTVTPTPSVQTLPTAGKAMTADVEVGAIPSGYHYLAKLWLPPDAALVASATSTINISADTSYDSWTPSTANTSILASGTARAACSYQFTSDTVNTTALVGFCLYRTVYAYPEGTTFAKGYQVEKWLYGVGHYAPVADSLGLSVSNYAMLMSGAHGRSAYWSSTTNRGLYASTAYGISPTGITWNASSSTIASRIVGFTRPAVYARCNSTYFSTTAANALDSANSYIECVYRIYSMPVEQSPLYALFDGYNGEFFA